MAFPRTIMLAALVVAALATPTVVAQQGPPSVPQAPRSSTPARAASGLADQVELSLAVYTSDLALVRDVRQLTFPSRRNFTLDFVDVAARVDPATVHLRSLTAPSALTILEQNYEYDLLEPERLLRKYVGREVTLVRDRQENGSTRAEEVKGLLLAYNQAPVWKIGNEIVTGLRVDQYKFPDLPDNLFSHPTLVWTLENSGPAGHRVEASYLTAGLSWAADYVLTVARDDRSADITGWVTVKNESGTAYNNARLQLVAGDVHRAPEDQAADRRKVQRALAVEAAAPPAFAQEAFSEYHLYTLQRPTSVNDRESKQVMFLAAPSLPVEKRFVVDGQESYFRFAQSGARLKDVVKVYYRIRNEEKSGLGIPMPAGVIRVYQADSKGGVLFAGEDRISHTPKDETLDLYTGNAFDIVCERRQMDFRKIAPSSYELEYEITLRNHKDSAVTVEVNEPIYGDWQIVTASHKWTKTGAAAARFEVPVPKDGTSVLKYRVRTKW